jgi:hypothetical protein
MCELVAVCESSDTATRQNIAVPLDRRLSSGRSWLWGLCTAQPDESAES